jgi:hypothetical protein
MKRIAIVSLFGIVLAIVLAFGISGKANASGISTNGRPNLVSDLGMMTEVGDLGTSVSQDQIDQNVSIGQSRERDADKMDQERASTSGQR